MCRFISMAFEDKIEAKKIFAGYSLWDSENNSFRLEVPSVFNAVWVTDAHCSCDFYSEPYDPIMAAEKIKKRFSKPKYRKKGWSQERIEREVEHILKKPSREVGGLSEPLYHCIKTYIQEIGSCYFHIGWYSGDQNKQGLKINERSEHSISSGSFKASEINEDVLYIFK